MLVGHADDHAQGDHGDADDLLEGDGLVEDQGGPDKEQDVAEAAPQVGGGQGDPLQDKLPADGIDSENDHCETEPEKISELIGEWIKSVYIRKGDLYEED